MTSDSPTAEPASDANDDTPLLPLTSEQIHVQKLDLDLVFPFALHDREEKQGQEKPATERLQNQVKWITKASHNAWSELVGSFPNPRGKHAETEYAEWVFFHPFIRSFLYDSKQDREAHPGNPVQGKSLRILQRKVAQSDQLEVVYFAGSLQSVVLSIRDVQLYLFDTGIGMLVVRLNRDATSTQPALTLKQTLDVMDRVRRLYAPYFDRPPEAGLVTAGHCPERLTLTIGGTSVVASFGTHTLPSGSTESEARQKESEARKNDGDLNAFCKHIEHVAEQCEPLTACVWKHLLKPLQPRQITASAPCGDAGDSGLSFEHIIDDRMPVMAYIAVDDPRRISTGDWLRLALIDDSGDSMKLPYSPRFTGPNPLKDFAYDRFWSMPGDPLANPKEQATRWLCCGYGFVGVGPADNLFYTDHSAGARAHARYHYFKLNLIAQFHRASLLVFKRRLADAVENLRQGSDQQAKMDEFIQTLRRIQLDLLTFRNMYWFTEVSNQTQPQELFDLQCRHLRTRELFEQVFDETEKATQFVLSEHDRRQTEHSARLNILVAGFVIVTPVVGVLSGHENLNLPARLSATLLLTVAAGFLLWCFAPTIDRWLRAINRWLRRFHLG